MPFTFPAGCVSSKYFSLVSSSFCCVSLPDFSAPECLSLPQSFCKFGRESLSPLSLTLSSLLSSSRWCCCGSARLDPAPAAPEAPFFFSLLLLCLQVSFCRPSVMYLITSQFSFAFVFSVYLFSLPDPLLSQQSFISLPELQQLPK